MLNPEKIDKLVDRISQMVDILKTYDRNLHVHKNVDQFYYMNRLEEIKLLHENFIEAKSRMDLSLDRFENKYREIYCKWKGDVRWLNNYLREVQKRKSLIEDPQLTNKI